ncbi:MAG: hypothetical protein ACHP93_03190 [Solirubrobacterales bacterium]
MQSSTPDPDTGDSHGGAAAGESGESSTRRSARGPGSLDGVTAFMGIRWEDPETVRLQIRAELINAGGLLSGVVTYALVDYCMGSTLWAQTTEQERINLAANLHEANDRLIDAARAYDESFGVTANGDGRPA